MAKATKKKATRATKQPQQQQQEERETTVDVSQLISANALKALLRSDDRRKESIDTLVGEGREEIGDAVERKRLHKKAYALVKKFHRIKSNETLADLWDTTCAYMDMAGITARIESVAALPLSDRDEAEEQEGRRGDTVTPFPQAVA